MPEHSHKVEEIHGPYRFTIEPRPAEIGGGWRFRAYEKLTGNEEIEVDGGIFPADGPAIRPGYSVGDQVPGEQLPDAHTQALAAARAWLAGMPKPEYRDAEHYMLGCFARDAAARLGE